MQKFLIGVSLGVFILSYLLIVNVDYFKLVTVYENATPIALPFIDLPHFNYAKECGESFRYQKHSQRDLIVYSHSHQATWDIQQYEIEQTLTLMRTSLPNVTAVVFTVGVVPPEFSRMMQRFSVVEIPASIEYENWNGVNARIPLVLEYLKKHQKEFDRVIWSDLRDVFYFTDVFKTFSVNDFMWLAECTGSQNFTFYNRHPHFIWMLTFKGKKVVKKFMESGVVGLNGGLGMGGINQMIGLLNDWNSSIEKDYIHAWGYDQTLLNMLILEGDTISKINMTIESCSQRMCFIPDQLVFKNNVAYYPTGCSPIVLHKGVPDHWRSLNGTLKVPEDK